MVNQAKKLNPQDLQQEVTHLKNELQMREQLVQQLSQELFRLVKGNQDSGLPSADLSDRYQAQVQTLREQLEGVEQQVRFYQEQISQRDGEIYTLRQSVQELTDRSQMLEQVVQELPGVYRQKFAERLEQVLEKVEMLQRENRQLHAELQSVSYRLAVKTRKASGLDLPSFGANSNNAGVGSIVGSIEMPNFGNA